jgi:hypothetical protein
MMRSELMGTHFIESLYAQMANAPIAVQVKIGIKN